ncbi:MAG: transposase, partial [Chloroflexi bacterium]|nr:transposase [Chloroflexota bacterium]
MRRALLTPANVNETPVADGLIAGDEAAVFGDAAYGTHARSARRRARRIQDQLMRHPRKHHHRLSPSVHRRPARIERVRRPVEHVFGTLKRSYGYQRVRYRGLARN